MLVPSSSLTFERDVSTIYVQADYVSNTFGVFDGQFLIYYLGCWTLCEGFSALRLSTAWHARGSRSVRMLSWCLGSGSVKKASCVCTFVRPNTLTFVPGASTFPTFMSWYSPRLFVDSRKSRSAAARLLYAGRRSGARSWRQFLRTCTLWGHACLVGICIPLWPFFPWLPAQTLSCSCYRLGV